jgi:hypothetical protein
MVKEERLYFCIFSIYIYVSPLAQGHMCAQGQIIGLLRKTGTIMYAIAIKALKYQLSHEEIITFCLVLGKGISQLNMRWVTQMENLCLLSQAEQNNSSVSP